MTLLIKNLHVKVGEKEILKGLTLEVKKGETVALMGPNGSGKSTLANTIMGKENHIITQGSITYNGKNIMELTPEERSHKGIFLSFQHPVEIPGLQVETYLKEIYQEKKGTKETLLGFRKILKARMEKLRINKTFSKRYLNQGFSGGEKKQMEILQMSLLEPTLAVLDETDSGLDIDALRNVAAGVNNIKTQETSILAITHYKRLLDYLKPERILILLNGQIAHEGGPELVEKLEKEGYGWMKE